MEARKKFIGAIIFALFAFVAFATQASADYVAKQVIARVGATTGEAITAGELVCIKDADGYAYAADANDAALRPAIGIAGANASSGGSVEIVVIGIFSGWSSLSEGAAGYLSETAGAVTQSAPAYAQQVGVAISATEYFVNCQNYLDTSAVTALGVLSGASPIILEGASANDFETTIAVTDPTADRTVTLADAGGTVMLSSLATNGVDAANAVTGASNGIVFEGATANDHETTITATDPTGDRTVTLADGSGTVMLSSLATNAPDAANSVTGASNALVYEGTANAHETSLTATDPTGDNTITLPDDSGAVAYSPGGGTTVAADVLAIPITHAYVAKTTGGDAEALTLADGENGQVLVIDLDTDGGGDGTLSPTTCSGFTSIVFEDAGDVATLMYVDDVVGWIITGLAGVAAPPVTVD